MEPLPNKILRSGIFDIFTNIRNEALKHELGDNTTTVVLSLQWLAAESEWAAQEAG